MQRLRTLLASNLAGETASQQPAPISAQVEGAVEDEDLIEIDPLDLFCSSIDTLLSRSIDQTIEPGGGWSSRPTRLSGVGDGRGEIQQMCRRGIPPSLRCAAWIINVVAAVNQEWSKSECDEFGTFRKVRVIDHGWELVLKSLFPDETDLTEATVIDMGIGPDQMMNLLLHDHGGSPIPDKGIQSLTKVLHAARDSLGLEFCPLLPDVTCLLLSFMPESYAYATIRQMVLDDTNYFLAISRVSHLSFCKTFSDLMARNFPQTHQAMDQIGALTAVGLDPILKRFFVPLLKRKHVLRIMDIYTSEGAHAIFRIGCTLCCLAHAHLDANVLSYCDSPRMWWEGVKRFTHSKYFHFDIFLQQQAYGSRQGSIRVMSRPIFPRSEYVSRLISRNEEWAAENEHHIPILQEMKPIGLVEGKCPIVLAKHSPERLSLSKWLPPALQSTRLELIYSSNYHGRSIEMFYRQCSVAIHTVTLLEVFNAGVVLGMYATQTWHNNPSGYGDGECFLFRLTPNPECFKYQVTASLTAKESLDAEEFISTIDDAGQLMISSLNFISMGVGEDGSSALRLNEDLTRGSTSRCINFGHADLIGDSSEVFEVGLVETYRFVRDVDGEPVDKTDVWKGLFD
mmetsp:Transcript_29977/g.71305  ORF Transcript_29977/g.71305 Transcript_29977/m.71305 type:complete len:624 (-) Transcript_29977:61-1932(-)